MKALGIERGSTKGLIAAWVILMLLTGATAVAGKVGAATHLGPIWLGALALVTLFKARMILTDYLGLYRAPGWRGGFTMALVLVIGAAFGLAIATPV